VITRVLRAVSPLGHDVVVSAPLRRLEEISELLPPDVHQIADDPGAWGLGPGGAILRLLSGAAPSPLLVVPADIPWIETSALARFVTLAAASGADVAVPVWASGETEHLVQWHPAIAGRPTYGPGVPPWGRPARGSDILRSASRTLLVPVGALTRDGRTWAHVTRPADLHDPSPRGMVDPSGALRCIAGEPKHHFGQGRAAEARGDPAGARRSFGLESDWYRRAGLPILAAHASADAGHAAEP
jgi:hypothetical protein